MLVCGMPSSEYWDGDATLARGYIKAFEQRRENSWWSNWSAGQYMMLAIACCFDKDTQYPEEPLEVTAKRERDEAELTAKRERDGYEHMMMLAEMINANIRAKRARESRGDAEAAEGDEASE